MNRFYVLILVCLTLALYSCNSKPAHPQADLINQDSATGMNEVSVRAFANGIDTLINTPATQKTFSLIYTLGEETLYTEKYSGKSGNSVFIATLNTGGLSKFIKRYYFKKDSLILVTINHIQDTDNGQVLSDTRTYLRNNTIFKRDGRTAATADALRKLPFTLISPAENGKFDEDYPNEIKTLNDALQQKNKFDMVFDHVTTYPDATFLMLKSKIPDGYNASLRLEEKDILIDSLLKSPAEFKDERLKLKWKIGNQEAIYVPSGSTSTSASGLNK